MDTYAPDPLKILADPVEFLADPLKFLLDFIGAYIWYVGVSFVEGHSSVKNRKRQRRKRQSVTAKREKSQTPKFV